MEASTGLWPFGAAKARSECLRVFDILALLSKFYLEVASRPSDGELPSV